MKTLKAFFFFFIFITISIPSYSQESEYHQDFKISLDVSGNDIIESQVYTLLSKKFRDINDIEIVDYKECYLVLDVIVLTINSKGNSKYGYVASITLDYKVKGDLIINAIAANRSTNENYVEKMKNIKSSQLGK